MQQSLVVQSPQALQPVPLRDVAALMFRHKRLLSISFFSILCLGVVVAALMPRTYESSLKLLATRERNDAVMTPERDNVNRYVPDEISEAELNSQVEMLRTDDLLRAVVLQTGLAGKHPTAADVDKAVLRLKSRLKIELINKSNLIGVTYRSGDPRLAANVLNTLASLFISKQLEVRRPTGQYEFFDQQAEVYKRRLADIEKQMADARIVSPQAMRDKTLQEAAELKAGLVNTQAAIAEDQRRIASLSELKSGTPERLTTEMRKSDNPQLLQNLKSTLLALSLKRDELLAKYQPSYRPVQDVERQIADTRAALAAEESKPMQEVSTNQNSTFEWIRTEMAKAQADLQGLRGREAASQRSIAMYDDSLRKLNVSGIGEQDLQREAASAEANYLLYSKKREEARISDELDQKKILNVVVVQAAAVPAIHVHQRKKMALLGMIAAILLSLGAVLISDSFDPRFRSPKELEAALDIPVLAAIPSAYELTKLSSEPGELLRGNIRAPARAVPQPNANGRGDIEY